MAQYHVGCGIAGIYAGILKKPGEWEVKNVVTDEAVSSVAQYLLENGLGFSFNYQGRRFRMSVEPVQEKGNTDEQKGSD